MTDETYAAFERERASITHGIDGALLGQDFCDMSRGHVQCRAILPNPAGGYLNCALQNDHTHGHRTAYVGSQPEQSKWEIVP